VVGGVAHDLNICDWLALLAGSQELVTYHLDMRLQRFIIVVNALGQDHRVVLARGFVEVSYNIGILDRLRAVVSLRQGSGDDHKSCVFSVRVDLELLGSLELAVDEIGTQPTSITVYPTFWLSYLAGLYNYRVVCEVSLFSSLRIVVFNLGVYDPIVRRKSFLF